MSLHRIRLAVFGLLLWAGGDALPAHTRSDPSAPSPSVLRSEFIFETAPFASAHASTIVETKQGLVAAWFGGTRERAADVGIWLSRQVDGTWTAPIEVATGIQPDGTRHPCWNPVLFELPDQTLLLFLQGRPNPAELVGHGSQVSRRGAHVERRATFARRHTRSHQEQARAARGWNAAQSEQHRVAGERRHMARTLRAQR